MMHLSPLVLLVLGLSSASVLHPLHLSRPSESVISMHGNLLPLGIFYTNISIGTPPVEYAVTIDTGSTDLLVPVAGCVGCKPGTATYSPSASSTSAIEGCNVTLNCSTCVGPHQNQCAFSDSYLTCDLSNLTALCSVSGGIYRDTVSIGGMVAGSVRFGGISNQTKNFDQFQHIDGILGLAFAELGFDMSPWGRVVQQNPDVKDVIQTCLTPAGGLLVLGQSDDDSKYYEGELMWTPIILDSWYTVHAESLDVAGKDTGIKGAALNGPFPDDPCIVDSGTNFLSLTSAAYDATVAAFVSLCPTRSLPGVCGLNTSAAGLFANQVVEIALSEMREFPNVTISLKGDRGGPIVPLTVTSAEYLVNVGEGKYRMGITRGDCIIGDTHMLRYWTVYDRGMNRIGFAPARHEECLSAREAMM